MALTEPVIDVSEHQGDINFRACYDAGIRHAIVRAGIGGRLDFKFDRNVEGFRAAGIGVPAAYWFINPKSQYTPVEQGTIARHACESWNIKTMMLDCEWYTGEGGPNDPIAGYDYNQWCLRFIAQLGSVRPIIYTSPSFWNSWGGAGSDFGSMDTIIASYKWQGKTNDPIVQGISPQAWGAAVAAKPSPALPIGWDTSLEGWQFSAGLNKQGPVYGMQSTDLDLNVVDPLALERWYGLDPLTPQEDEDMPRLSAPYVFVNAGATGHLADGRLVTFNTDGTYFFTDGQMQTYRWVGPDPSAKGDIDAIANANGVSVLPIDGPRGNLDAFGVLIGRVPIGATVESATAQTLTLRGTWETVTS